MSRENDNVKKWELGEETGRTVGTVALLLGSEGDTEIELESSPEGVICGRKDREGYPQGDTKCTRRGVPSGRQAEPKGGDEAGGLAVSFRPGCLSTQRMPQTWPD